jgi:hypothetical protein
MERNSQSTGFGQHEKARFNIQKLKSRLNKRACVRVFFETHYAKKARAARNQSRSHHALSESQKARMTTKRTAVLNSCTIAKTRVQIIHDVSQHAKSRSTFRTSNQR